MLLCIFIWLDPNLYVLKLKMSGPGGVYIDITGYRLAREDRGEGGKEFIVRTAPQPTEAKHVHCLFSR